MTKVNKKLIDRILKRFRPSRKTTFVFVFLGIVIMILSTYRGISEEWSLQVTNALITINGTMLGFAILGITVLSTRGYAGTFFRKSVRQSATEFASHVEEMLESPDEHTINELKEEFLLSLLYPFADSLLLKETFLLSIRYFLFSIGCALCLFGINTDVLNNIFLKTLFLCIYSLSITAFLWGTYFIMYGVRNILEGSLEINVKKQLEIATSIFEKEIEDLEKKLKTNKKI